MSWSLRFTKEAQRDAVKLDAAGLRPKTEALLDIVREDPFHRPPPFEKLVGDLRGAYSRRIDLQHRLVYEVIADGRPGGEGAAHVDPLRVGMTTP